MKKCSLLESPIVLLTYVISRGTETIMPKNTKKVQYCHHQTTRNEFPERFSPEQEMLD